MTPTPTDPSAPHTLSEDPPHVGFLDGHWVPYDQMQVSVDDFGFRQGVTAVERLRTYSGRIFAVDAHLKRWENSTGRLDIDGLPSPGTIKSRMEELLRRNTALLQSEGDVGITMFATPGVPQRDAPTFGLHLNRLDHARIARHVGQGQPIVITDVKQPDPDCWPRSIKMRSRIHYYRADRIARQQHEDAVGILLDSDGSVTETSVSNIAIVQSGQILSPPADRVLGGITQSVIESIAAESAIVWSKRPISVGQLTQADEILMLGTGAGIWFANSVNGLVIGKGKPGEVFQSLREKFEALINRQANGSAP